MDENRTATGGVLSQSNADISLAAYGASAQNYYKHKYPFLVRVTRHFFWIYIARPLLTAGFFVTLGFVLFGSTFDFSFAIPGSLLMTRSLTSIAMVFTALAGAVIAGWVIQRLKSSVADTPISQVIVTAVEVRKILAQCPGEKNIPSVMVDALVIHIEHAKELLSSFWREGLASYSDQQIKKDYRSLSIIQTALTITNAALSSQYKSTLATIFARFLKDLDPTYKPPLSFKMAIPLVFIPSVLFIGCLAILFFIFTGVIHLHEMVWSMSFVAVFGFSAWVMVNYFLNKTSGGIYAVWAVIFGVVGLTCLTLACTVFKLTQVLSVSPLFGISILLLISCIVLTMIAGNYANKTKPEKMKIAHTWYYRWFVERSLIVLKVILLIGFLFLDFLSMVTLFNLSGFGQLGNLLGVAFDGITIVLGSSGFEVGTKWFDVFCMGIFSTASFMAFELWTKMIMDRYNAVLLARCYLQKQKDISVDCPTSILETAGYNLLEMQLTKKDSKSTSLTLMQKYNKGERFLGARAARPQLLTKY